MRKTIHRPCVVALAGLMLLAMLPTGCRMAPNDQPGDTVAASAFAPVDTAALNRKARLAQRQKPVKDSLDIFYVGEGSTKGELQLISYPSRRDTIAYGKTRHVKRSGNTDFGHIVRVKLWISDRGDTLVQRVEELTPANLASPAGQTAP